MYKRQLTLDASENGIRRYYISQGADLYNFMSRASGGVIFNIQRGDQFLVVAGFENGGDQPKGLYTGDPDGNPYPTGTLPELPIAGNRDNKVPKFNGDELEWEEDRALPPQTLTSAANITWDINEGTVADLTLGHNVTLTLSNGSDGEIALLLSLIHI